MHPAAAFAWGDEAAMLAFVADVAFCTIFAADGGGAVVHVPVTVDGGALRFHVSRANRAAPLLEGAAVLLSCVGPDAYVSPDWYGTPGQVPTWNYLAVEIEGSLRQLGETELVAHIDALARAHEARLAPKPPWTRDKMAPDRFAAMLGGIAGFELTPSELRGTRKLGQHKNRAEREGAIAGLEAAGRADIAAAMRAAAGAHAVAAEPAELPAILDAIA